MTCLIDGSFIISEQNDRGDYNMKELSIFNEMLDSNKTAPKSIVRQTVFKGKQAAFNIFRYEKGRKKHSRAKLIIFLSKVQ